MAHVRTRWDIVALALTAGQVVGMQFGKVPPALPMLQTDFGMSCVVAGHIASSKASASPLSRSPRPR